MKTKTVQLIHSNGGSFTLTYSESESEWADEMITELESDGYVRVGTESERADSSYTVTLFTIVAGAAAIGSILVYGAAREALVLAALCAVGAVASFVAGRMRR